MRDAALTVIRKLQANGFEAFLVGGCVRDMILGDEPKDFDVTTNALPIQVQVLFEKTLPIGASFGVIIVVIDGVQIEVATYRTDGLYSDGRRPDTVEYGKTAREDVERRDFTINGLLMMPTLGAESSPALQQRMLQEEQADKEAFELRDGTTCIVDFVGGREDIDNRLIRCIGDPNKRFTEDALRMMRAVRFAAKLGFDIADSTLKAIEKNGSLLQKISKERIAMELFKIVSSPFPLKGLVPFIATGLANFALPQSFLHTSRLVFTLQRFQFTTPRDPLLGMAMLLADSDVDVARETCGSLKLSNEDTQEIVGAVGLVDVLGDTLSYTPAGVKRMARRVGLSNALVLFEQEPFIGKVKRSAHTAMEIGLAYKLTKDEIYPTPLVTGDDLIAAGVKPSPIFRDVLYAVETKQLDGFFNDRETALKYALAFIRGFGV